jgi:DNA-binding transcriptional LysR family regulator
VLPRLLQDFSTRRPGVYLQLDELIRELGEDERLVVEPLRREPLVLVLPTSHRLASTRRARLADVASEPLILFPRAEVPRLHDLIVSLCRAADFAPRTTQEAVQFPTILGLVSAGVGIAIVPATVRALRQSGVAYLPLTDRGAVAELALAFPADRESAVLREFVQTALDSGRSDRSQP